MAKINADFIVAQYRIGIKNYQEATKELGLWASEAYVFQKYLSPSDSILDLGCGTGRTTYALYQLGYTNLVGIDLTPEMITTANDLARHFSLQINFQIGDATALSFVDSTFSGVLFSFNGLMSIPEQARRDQALSEIRRVLQPGGHFIFTTHDRDREEQYLAFWREQRQQWDAGEGDGRLYQFGDLITQSKNEEREIFIHIPSRAEVWSWLKAHGFTVQETFYRRDRFRESEAVRQVSGECRFWVARKVR